MTATDKLRELLDERGVEWWAGDDEDDRKTHWIAHGLTWEFYSYEDGTPHWLGFFGACESDITPEQAIEATLGRGTCHDTNEEEHDFTCSACGASMYTQVDDCWVMVGAGGLTKDVIEHPNYCPNCGKKVCDE